MRRLRSSANTMPPDCAARSLEQTPAREPFARRSVEPNMSIRTWRRLCALFVATLLVMLSPSWASAQEAEVDAFMQRQMAARHIPGVSIAVVKDGRVVLQRGYGVANVEHQVPATE